MVGGSNAPGASEGDAYKIFNQAETESQKIMGESAAQPSFNTSIRILVSSKEKENPEKGVHAIVAAASMFTDEYNNALDNPQVIEDAIPGIIGPIRYFGFKYKLVGMMQNTSIFSADEVSTMYHLPDITYNRSPIIRWLEYKKLPIPHNLKTPGEATILEEKVQVGQKSVIDPETKETKVMPQYEVKMVHRHLGGFPVYKDGVLLGWNEYRGVKTPVYFDRKDRGRHHYII